MNTTSWLEENVYKKIEKNKARTVTRVMFLLVLTVGVSFWQAQAESSTDFLETPSLRIGLMCGIGLLLCIAITVLRLNRSVYQKKIEKFLEGKGTIEEFDEDMKNAKRFDAPVFSIFVGKKYVFTVYWTTLNPAKLQVIRYDMAVTMKVMDYRYNHKERARGIEIQLVDASGKEVGIVNTNSKDHAIEIVEEIERNISIEK
ncbi:DUF6709 family protein [Anaerosporobacter sp.]|uniref:DUF6709 family protein n=1 Tax=Anaerosporobacter sp. TaxID=1872529 RepID=UPI00286EB613|nr:DUF6709 family protein [Anaerosporobacter sp.]